MVWWVNEWFLDGGRDETVCVRVMVGIWLGYGWVMVLRGNKR